MKYRREIDGLRALAVLPVIFFHAGFPVFGGGFVGVDVFFVISGYLITTIIVNEIEQGSFSLLEFYERRIRRILPALFFAMLCTLPVAWFWLLAQELKSFSQSLVAVTLFASNILFYVTSDYFDTAAELKPMLHTWSLAVEEQYYVFFPIILMLTWKLGRRWIVFLLSAAAIMSALSAQWISSSNPSFAFYLLPTRVFELLIGALVSFYMKDKTSVKVRRSVGESAGIVGLLLILYSIFTFDKTTPFPSLYTLAPTIGVALIIIFADQATFVGKALGNRIFVGVGLISYSAYIWHHPIFAFARLISIDAPSKAFMAILIILSLAMACFSWKFIELPFRNRKMMSRRQVFLFGAVGSFAFLLIGLAGHFTKGYEARLPDEVASLGRVFREEKALIDEGACHLKNDEQVLVGCARGASGQKPQFALVGDSHANALAYELSKAFSASGSSFIQHTKNSCPLAPGFIKKKIENCDKFQSAYLRDPQLEEVGTYIVSARWSFYIHKDDFDNGEGGVEKRRNVDEFTAGSVPIDAPYEARKASVMEGFRQAIVSLLNSGKRVILIYPVPAQGWDVPSRLSKQLFYRSDVSINGVNSEIIRKYDAEIVSLFDQLGERNDLVRVYPSKIFCETYVKDRCVSMLNNIALYYDSYHLSNAGAKLVVEEIMKIVK